MIFSIALLRMWTLISEPLQTLRFSAREDLDSLLFESLQGIRLQCANTHTDYLSELEKFRKNCLPLNNEYLNALMDYHWLASVMTNKNNAPAAQKAYLHELQELKNSKFPEIRIYGLIVQAMHFYPANNIGYQQEALLKAYNTGIRHNLQKTSAFNTVNLALGNLYLQFEDYSSALNYLLAQNHSHFNNLFNRIHCLNNLAMCYIWTNEPDKALPCLYTLLNLTEKNDIKDWDAISHGNIGRIFLDKKMYLQAIPHLYKDFTVSCANQNWDCGLLSGVRLLKVYNETRQFNKSAEIFLKLSQTASYGNIKTKIEYFQTAAEYFQLTGNILKSNVYFDSAITAQKEFQKKRETEQLALHKTKIQAEKYLSELELAHENIALKTNIRNILVFVLVLFIIIALLTFFSLRLRTKRKKEILELELQLANIAKNHLESENNKIKSRLDSVIQDLREKSLKIEKYETRSANKKDSKYTETLTKMHLSTDENWYKFKQQFKTIHPAFIQEISEELPEITPGEIRYLCLLKLSLEPFEIANLLGIGKESVQKIKQRIKNKIEPEKALQISKLIG